MQIEGDLFRKHTPVFRVAAAQDSFFGRAWGALYHEGAWLFPAFPPFGTWVCRDLRQLAPSAKWSPEALEHLARLKEAEDSWSRAKAAWDDKAPVPLSLPEDFFAQGFTPYNHQRLGVAKLLSAWRAFLVWTMGTGKTRTVVDALRALRDRGQFRKALVLGPPVVLSAWIKEVARCSGGAWSTAVWDGTRKGEARAQEADVVLCSYTMARLMRERAETAKRELGVTQEMRARYKLPQLTQEELEEYQWEGGRPLLHLGYDVIVADESHYLGNWSSGQTQAAVELSTVAPRRYCLTGTPGDDPRKLYGQLFFLSPSLVPMAYGKFEERHVKRSPRNKHLVVGFRFLNELNERVDGVALRMKKEHCLDLPPVTTVDLPFELGPGQRARYNEMVLEMRISDEPILQYFAPASIEDAELPEVATSRLPHGAARANKLRQLISGFVHLGADYSICDACAHMPGCVEQKIRPYTKHCKVVQAQPERRTVRDVENPKRELFESTLKEILEEDPTNKVLVWTAFVDELDDIEQVLQGAKLGYVRVAENTPKRVQENLDRFHQDDACRVWCGHVSTAIGISLTPANYTIFYSLPWDPLTYDQAVDRNNRPGQTRPMVVYRLLTAETTWGIDRFVARAITFKKRIALTIAEVVACAQCDRQVECEAKNILPFREKCKYAANVERPVTQVEVIE